MVVPHLIRMCLLGGKEGCSVGVVEACEFEFLCVSQQQQ
jgi:hypothetical protein